MFLRNVAIDLQIHGAPKSKTSTTTLHSLNALNGADQWVLPGVPLADCVILSVHELNKGFLN
jgi:hypothetical protein